MPKEQRLSGIDFMRALACLMVVGHHLIFRLDAEYSPLWARKILGFMLNGSYGVAIFFCLSGFLLARPFWIALDRAEDMPDLRTYALRRAARILPGFWVALTVSFLADLLLGSPFDGQGILRYLAGLTLLSGWHWVTLFPVSSNGPLWSISFEVASYVLMPLCFAAIFAFDWARGWMARRLWIGVILAAIGAHWLITIYAPIDDVGRGWEQGLLGGAKEWMPRFNPIGFFAIFALGSMAAGIQVRWRQVSGWAFDGVALFALVGAFSVMAINIGRSTEGYALLGLPYAFPAFPLLMCLFLVTAPSSKLVGRLVDNRVSRFFATISFGIYLWHFVILEVMARLTPLALNSDASNSWTVWLIASAIAVATSILAGTLSYYLLERRVVEWARKFENRAPSAQARLSEAR